MAEKHFPWREKIDVTKDTVCECGLLHWHHTDLGEARCAANRYHAALRQIARGKLAEDNAHPLGEYASMAMRFLTIAQNALRPVQAPGDAHE